MKKIKHPVYILFFIAFLITTYTFVADKWGPLAVITLHVTYGLATFMIMIAKKELVVSRWNIRLTGLLTAFILFGGPSLFAILYLPKDDRIHLNNLVNNQTPKTAGMIKYPNLPHPDWIHWQTTYVGTNVFIVGLSLKQAEEIVRYAEESGVAGTGRNKIRIEREDPLSQLEREALARKGFNMPDDSVEVYLGHTEECHKPLFQSLGIPSK